jgi:hypothetical protein
LSQTDSTEHPCNGVGPDGVWSGCCTGRRVRAGPSAPLPEAAANSAESAENLIGIDEVQRSLNRSRASVYRYTNTDPRNLNPAFNPRKLNPEYRSDQKEPLMFHPNEVARFARDVLRIKEVTGGGARIPLHRPPSSCWARSLKSCGPSAGR